MASEAASDSRAPEAPIASRRSDPPARTIATRAGERPSLPQDLIGWLLRATPGKTPAAAKLDAQQIRTIKAIGNLPVECGEGAIAKLPQLPKLPSTKMVRERYCQTGSLTASRYYFDALGRDRRQLVELGLDWAQRDRNALCRDFQRRRVSHGGNNVPEGHSSARNPENALRAQKYFERLIGPTRRASAGGAAPADLLAVLGNLGPSSEGRCQFWRDIILLEPPSRGRLLVLDPKTNSDFWQAAHARPDCPPEFEKLRGRSATVRLPITGERLEEILLWCGLIGFPCSLKPRISGKRSVIMTDADGKRIPSPITRSAGRGGTIAHKFRAALPHELPRETCIAIAGDFAGYFENRGLPVCVVVHAPPARGDGRNIHLHGLVYPRPGKLLPDGSWDLQLKTAMRRAEPSYPLWLPSKDRELAKADFTFTIWSYYVDLVNSAFEKAGIDQRWIASSFADAELDQPVARVALDTGSFRAESRGVISTAGRKAAAQFIDYRLAQMRELRLEKYRATRMVIDGLGLRDTPKQHPDLRPVRTVAAECLRLTRWSALLDERLDLLRLLEASLHPAELRRVLIERELSRDGLPKEARDRLREAAELAAEHSAIRRHCQDGAPALAAFGELATAVGRRKTKLLEALRNLGSIGKLLETVGRLFSQKEAPSDVAKPQQGPGPRADMAPQALPIATIPLNSIPRDSIADHLKLQAASSASGKTASAIMPNESEDRAALPGPQLHAGAERPDLQVSANGSATGAHPPVPAGTHGPTALPNRSGNVTILGMGPHSSGEKPTAQEAERHPPVPPPSLGVKEANSTAELAADERSGATPDVRDTAPGPRPLPAQIQEPRQSMASTRPAEFPAAPPGLVSYHRDIEPEDEVLALIDEAESALQPGGSREALHLAGAALHWVRDQQSRAYLGHALTRLMRPEEAEPCARVLRFWADLALPPRLVEPAPLSEGEFGELIALLNVRPESGFGFNQKLQEHRAAELSYRLAHHPDPLVKAGYVTMAYTGLPPRDAARSMARDFGRAPGAREIILGWYASVGLGEERAIVAAVESKVRDKAFWSGLDEEGQGMYGQLIWLQEFDALLATFKKAPDHLDRSKFGPSNKEEGAAADYFRSHPAAARILRRIAPEVWHRTAPEVWDGINEALNFKAQAGRTIDG